MDLRDRTIVILGGSGLVGHAVACRQRAAGPKRQVRVGLFEDEVRATASALAPHRGRTAIDVEWGNVFLPAPVARLDRTALLAEAAHRRLMIEDMLGDLTDEVLQRSLVFQILDRYRPDAVVDSINTATAFAYQDQFQSPRAPLAPAQPAPATPPA